MSAPIADCRLPTAVLTLVQVAERLQLTPEAFMRKRPRLQREHGFPRVLPGLCERWSAAQIDDWIEHGGGAAVASADKPGTPLLDKLVARDRARLEARMHADA
jgi:hypothetical protein